MLGMRGGGGGGGGGGVYITVFMQEREDLEISGSGSRIVMNGNSMRHS